MQTICFPNFTTCKIIYVTIVAHWEYGNISMKLNKFTQKKHMICYNCVDVTVIKNDTDYEYITRSMANCILISHIGCDAITGR